MSDESEKLQTYTDAARTQRKTYPIKDYPGRAETERLGCKKLTLSDMYSLGSLRAVFTGEYRNPKAGEWFLSGAKIEAYLAKKDLSTPYHIARLVRVEVKTIEVIVQE